MAPAEGAYSGFFEMGERVIGEVEGTTTDLKAR
jgi:hypothetical protein